MALNKNTPKSKNPECMFSYADTQCNNNNNNNNNDI